MAITDVEPARRSAAWRILLRLRRGIDDLRSGEHSAAKKSAGAAFAIRIASAAIVFASQALLAHWIGGAEFGTYVYVWTWLLLAGDLVHLGLPLTAQRFVPEYNETYSIDLLRGYVATSRWLVLAAGAVVGLSAAVVIYSFKGMLDRELVVPLYLACAALPAFGLTFMSDGLARSYNWINLALLPAYVIRPLILIVAIACLRAADVPLSATTVMATLVAAAWIAALVQTLQLNRRLATVVAAGPQRRATRQWLGTALPIILVWGLYTLMTSTDVLVLKQFRPAEDVGHYYAAAKTLALVSIITFAVAAATAHRFTAYHVAHDRAGLVQFAASTVRWVFWPSLALALLILALGRPLLMLFGRDFVAGYPVMLILAVGLLARASIGPTERLLNMLGQQRICALAYAAAFAFNLVVCLLLAPAYGALGAATATAGAFGVESMLLFLIARYRLGLFMFVWDPWRANQLHQSIAGRSPHQG